MKINIPRTLALLFAISISVNGYSQDEKHIKDKIWANWILESINYAETNYEILPWPFVSILLNRFNSLTDSYSESFNGKVLTFLNENFFEDIKNKKTYFIRSYSGFGCINNYSFFVLNESNQMTEINMDFRNKGTGLSKSKTTQFSFREFEKRFNSYQDFERVELKESSFANYYLITEFNRGLVKIKIVMDEIELD